MPDLTGAEFKVLMYITRRTFGFKKDSDNISLSQMLHGIRTKDGRVLNRGVGLSKKTLLQALNSLEDKDIIQTERRRSAERGDEPTSYRLNIISTDGGGEKTTPPVGEKLHHGGGGENTPGPWGKNYATQQTQLQSTQEQDVVVVRDVLEKFGITPRVADQLTGRYPEAYLLEKLDLVQWLVETHSPLVGKNPAGYLRRAIEEDYTAPSAYRSPAQRHAEAAAQAAAGQRDQQQRLAAEAEYAREQAVNHEKLAELYPPAPIAGTELTTAAVWEQTLAQLQSQMTHLNFELWLSTTALVRCEQGTALVVAPSRFQAEHLRTRLQPLIARTLTEVLGQSVRFHVVALTELLATHGDGTTDTDAALAPALPP
jgi:hypothetical protein